MYATAGGDMAAARLDLDEVLSRESNAWELPSAALCGAVRVVGAEELV